MRSLSARYSRLYGSRDDHVDSLSSNAASRGLERSRDRLWRCPPLSLVETKYLHVYWMSIGECGRTGNHAWSSCRPMCLELGGGGHWTRSNRTLLATWMWVHLLDSRLLLCPSHRLTAPSIGAVAPLWSLLSQIQQELPGTIKVSPVNRVSLTTGALAFVEASLLLWCFGQALTGRHGPIN